MKLSPGRLARSMLLIFVIVTLTQPVLAAPLALSLDDCVALALQNNPAMKIAEAGREKNRWAVKQAEAGTGFTVSFAHSDNRYSTPPNPANFVFDYTYHNKFDNDLSLGWTLYSGGKLEGQIDQAKLNLKIGDLNLDATRQQLKLSAASAYFAVLEYRNILAVNQDSVDDLDTHLKNVQAQFGAGMVPKADVLYSQVQLASAQDGLIRARTNYENAVDNLNTVTGLPMNTEVKLKDDLRYAKYALTMEECVEYALQNRPEMAEHQANASIAQDGVTIAKSGYRPTVSFKGSQDWYDEHQAGFNNSNWLVSLTTSFNVLDSGLTESELKQAQYNLETAKEQARQNRDSVTQEVRQAYHGFREAEKRIATTEVAVEQAEEDYKISEVGYSMGMTANLNVIDAELALAQAKTLYIQALYDYNNSKAQLDKAMGLAVK